MNVYFPMNAGRKYPLPITEFGGKQRGQRYCSRCSFYGRKVWMPIFTYRLQL